MKNLQIVISIAFLILFGFPAYAQPTATQVQSDIAKTGRGSLGIEVIGDGENTVEWENSTKVYYHRRRVKTIGKTRFSSQIPESKAISEGLAVYKKNGSKYVFVKYNPGEAVLTGMPPIDVEKINQLITTNIKELVTNCHQKIGPQLTKLEMKENSVVTWHSATSFSFKIDTIYMRSREGDTRVEYQRGEANIRFYRDNIESDWTRVMPSSGWRKLEVIKDEFYTEAELDSWTTIDQYYTE